jgi:hypothetical protein
VSTFARLTPVGILVTLALAPSAHAAIQVDRGIAGARLGNTRGEVRAALGSPSKTATGTNEFGPFVTYRYAGKITVNFQGRDRVTSVETAGLGDRTAGGIGVGSTDGDLKNGVKGLQCESLGGTTSSCRTGPLQAGKRITDFRIADGKVQSILVGIVID